MLKEFYGELYRERIVPCTEFDDVTDWHYEVEAAGSLIQFSANNKVINPKESKFTKVSEVNS